MRCARRVQKHGLTRNKFDIRVQKKKYEHREGKTASTIRIPE